ncbi:response regulator [Pedobacter miscanthi]|uniref:Response regulator n=1 Tax=Pedobacter miscanthi TaxID=2259170 RepID=A0A366KRV9_9SPHI|nr:response regulator [Pedobacter miscanthi]RBQ04248.1 response regulator [Pedobacter miscanthi]
MGKKICLLEDDEGIREIIEMILTDEHYEVYGFSNVKDFMAFEDKGSQDLYLLDVRLPDGSGLMVCDDLKNNESTKSIPIMMMSAHASLNEMKHTCKAEEFIAKPFDIFDLLKKVDQQLSKRN